MTAPSLKWQLANASTISEQLLSDAANAMLDGSYDQEIGKESPHQKFARLVAAGREQMKPTKPDSELYARGCKRKGQAINQELVLAMQEQEWRTGLLQRLDRVIQLLEAQD